MGSKSSPTWELISLRLEPKQSLKMDRRASVDVGAFRLATVAAACLATEAVVAMIPGCTPESVEDMAVAAIPSSAGTDTYPTTAVVACPTTDAVAAGAVAAYPTTDAAVVVAAGVDVVAAEVAVAAADVVATENAIMKTAMDLEDNAN